MTELDRTPDASAPASPLPTASAPEKVLNQSHWRAAEQLIEGLREGRSVIVVAAEPCAGAEAALVEAIAGLPKRMKAVESGAQAATLEEVIAPLDAALGALGAVAPDQDTPAERVRAGIESLANADEGVAYFLAPEEALSEDALVYLARLAAAGRRLTRDRLAAREAAGATLRGPVGAQVVICAPPDALPALAGLGDGALRRAAESAVEIQLFDAPALRAAYRGLCGATLTPGGADYALAATGGAQRHVEALLTHPILLRADRGGEGAPFTATAQKVARAVAALGLPAPADLDPTALDAADIRAEARQGAAERVEAAADQPAPEQPGPQAPAETGETAQAALDVAAEAPAAEDAPMEAGSFEAVLAETPVEPAIAGGEIGTPTVIERETEAEAEVEAEAEARADAPAFETLEIDEAAAQEALDEALIEAILEEDLSGDDGLQGGPAEAGAAEQPAPVADLQGALDAAKQSVEHGPDAPERAAEAGGGGAMARMLAAIGLKRRATAAERLRLKGGAPSRTLGAVRRNARVAAGVAIGALAAGGATLLAIEAMDAEAGRSAARSGAFERFETGDLRPRPADDGLDEPMLSGLVGEALGAAETAARAVAESVAPTEGAAEGLSRFADDLFDARGEIDRARMSDRLAALSPEQAELRLNAVLGDALLRAERHAAAGRYTAPAGANAYEDLLKVYPLSPTDPRVRGALSALVRHYDEQAAKALIEQRYQAFHHHNRIADRIRARKPI